MKPLAARIPRAGEPSATPAFAAGRAKGHRDRRAATGVPVECAVASGAEYRDMNPNAFIGRTKAPSDADVAAALGAVKPLWDDLVVGMARELGLTGSEWKSYSVKHGWALQLRRGKRNIVHLAPCQGSFHVLIILGDRAVAAARAARLDTAAAKLIDAAPRYPEGTGIRLDVSRARQIPLVRKLARIKLEN
jgi:hypothetical protein